MISFYGKILNSVNLSFLFLLLPLFIFLFLYLRWEKYSKDPKVKIIEAKKDAPEGLSPMEMSTVFQSNVSFRSISAETIYLAIKGYIKIERIEKKVSFIRMHDYAFTRLIQKDPDSDFDAKLLNSLFRFDPYMYVELSDLKKIIFNDFQTISDLTADSVTKKKYFENNYIKNKGIYIIFSILFCVVSYFFRIDWIFSASMFYSGIIILVFGLMMPKKTKKGLNAQKDILGLKKYLQTIENDGKNISVSEKKVEVFEKLLPYAVVFDAESSLIRKFEGIYESQPSWYNDPGITFWSGLAFEKSFKDFVLESLSAFSDSGSLKDNK